MMSASLFFLHPIPSVTAGGTTCVVEANGRQEGWIVTATPISGALPPSNGIPSASHSVIENAEAEGKTTVRLHTGDPCIYGAIREQMDILDEKGISYDYCPGVSAFCGAASALNLEYTLPEISQSVIITRMEGRTPVPSKESIQSFAAHQATMVVFLSTGMLEELSRRLIEGGYTADTPAAIVYKATWPDEKKFVCTVGTLAQTAAENNITKTALMIIGDSVKAAQYDRSKLYDPGFTTEFREATK